MPLVTLKPVLAAARARGGAALGMVCLGWEDAAEFVAAGEATGVPVILSAGPGARAAVPVAVWGAMFRALGEVASIPVVAHLDHGKTLEECQAALDAGFSSVMIDGSDLPLAENIALTQKVARAAETYQASVEAEVGVVGYADGAPSETTAPADAEALASETAIDCLAVSVGNVHLTQTQSTPLDWGALEDIRSRMDIPLVLHGGSGVPDDDRARAAREFGVAKINLGTEIRQAYGRALRETLQADDAIFDRLSIGRAVANRRADVIQKALALAWT